jgi:pyridoxal phosphate enzyme (YggS family)
MSSLQDRLEKVRQRMNAAEQAAHVPAGSVDLVAVTKTHPAQTVRQLYDLGIRQFGESRAQELVAKVPELPDDVSWHMIGHLQENKINKVLPHAALIQSVDSLRLAQAISKRAERLQRVVPVLLEVKTDPEAAKSGVEPEQARDVYAQLTDLPGLALRGLMTMAPNTTEEATVRRSFQQLRRLFESLASVDPAPEVLSMGMSQDFEWAIQEGATMVRIGRALVAD